MKKILFLASFCVAVLVGAKDKKKIELTTFIKDKVEISFTKPLYCQEYSIEPWCTAGSLINDTVCYDPNNSADRDHAFACMDENARLTNIFFCGRETPRITQDVSFN